MLSVFFFFKTRGIASSEMESTFIYVRKKYKKNAITLKRTDPQYKEEKKRLKMHKISNNLQNKGRTKRNIT